LAGAAPVPVVETASPAAPVNRSGMQAVAEELPQAWLLTEKEAASALSISPRKLWELRNRGEVPHVRFGRSVRYDPDDLKNWLKSRKTTR
jgi:excisionase family DNA binding protein